MSSLIGDRIQQGTDRRDLAPAASQMAVEQIGRGRSQENCQRQKFMDNQHAACTQFEGLLHQRRHQQRDEEDSQQC